jgi:hypothetical protein
VTIEAGQGSLNAIEPPTGEPALVGRHHEKQVQAQVLGPELWKEALAAEAMVDPGEGAGNGARPLRHQERQRFFEWHGMVSGVRTVRGEGVAQPLASSAARRGRIHAKAHETACTKHADFKSPWNWNNARRHARGERGKKNVGRKSNQQKNKTTVTRACPGK